MEIQPKQFYSAAGNLIVNVNKGHRITNERGISTFVDQKTCEFVPLGDGFGRLITDDPEVIAMLDKRMGVTGDVFDGAEYMRRTTPAEVRVKLMEERNARLIEDNNRLLQKLEAEGKLVAPGLKQSK